MTAVIQAAAGVSASVEVKYQTKRPIDLVHLAKFTMGDTALEEEILGLFERQSQLYIGQLEKSASAKEWFAAAHTIKGSAKSVGAFHVAKLAEEAEKLGDEASAAEKTVLLQKMRTELDSVSSYIQGLLGSRAQ